MVSPYSFCQSSVIDIYIIIVNKKEVTYLFNKRYEKERIYYDEHYY